MKNYGYPVWIDPEPSQLTSPQIPQGHHDFVGILIHEIFHGLGMIHYTKEWRELIEVIDGVDFFNGDKTVALLGEPLPFSEDHYGHNEVDAVVSRGMMYLWGNYDLNRWDIGRLDLAILEDLGYTIKTYDGLPLVELPDHRPNLSGNNSGNIIYGDYQNNTLRGMAGNDLIYAGAGNDLIEEGPGSDTIVGGNGIDTVRYSGERVIYSIEVQSTTTFVVSSDSEVDRISEVERLEFNNLGLAFDLNGHAGDAVKILGAFFGSDEASNPAVVGQTIKLLDDGITQEYLIRIFLNEVFGEDRDGQRLVTHFYETVVGSAAPKEVVSHYGALIESGELSPADLSLLVVEHELNLVNIDIIDLSQTGIEYLVD
ncbi:MAG: hypothetical protein OXD01_03640 [Gammaproteobacteria bacterium]|nr:hypothetical protein [Gammaproteobacteria bacterium]